ncbi:MAG: type I-B CRISPR-associated protein Cas7/Cst2/DevR, partial [Thermoplasmata archaeon]
PVKISHAISMTPFNYDALFNANIGMANRMRKVYGEMKPNPFTSEEHETFYQYTTVIDIGSISTIDLYLKENSEIKEGKNKWKVTEVKCESNVKVKLTKKDKAKIIEEKIIETAEGVKKLDFSKIDELYHIKYSTEDSKEKVRALIKIILNLHRSIKGRNEDLTPKLLALGLYNNTPYQTFKDRIALVDENIEETYDEITEITEEGKKIVKIIHKTVKEAKPKFRIYVDFEKAEVLKEEKIIEKIGGFLDKGEEEKCTEIEIFKLPEIDIEFSKEENQ